MTTTYSKLKPLCTASEWRLVQESLPGIIESYTLHQIKIKTASAGRLREKWADLSRKQKRAANDLAAANRTMEKSRLFAYVHESLKKRLRTLEREAARHKISERHKLFKGRGGTDMKDKKPSKAIKTPKTSAKTLKVGLPAAIKGHISSRNKRDQAKRDSK